MTQHTSGVVLLHGLGRTGVSMQVLGNALRKAGHATLTPTYGLYSAMPAILDYLEPRVAAFQKSFDGPLHFVTHSLGGLIVRTLLTSRRPMGLGRVVMLAPPNCGSELADLVTMLGLSKPILGQVGSHLRTVRTPDVERALGQVDYDLGIIAGDRPFDPVLTRLLPRPNDGKVTVAATKVAGMRDHIVLPVSHTLMVLHPQVSAQVVAYIGTGRFTRAESAPPEGRG